MPYINAADRVEIQCGASPLTVGELNYAITQMCIDFLAAAEGRYSDYNSIVGVLECAKQEFYRRAVAVYEDECILNNGDCY